MLASSFAQLRCGCEWKNNMEGGWSLLTMCPRQWSWWWLSARTLPIRTIHTLCWTFVSLFLFFFLPLLMAIDDEVGLLNEQIIAPSQCRLLWPKRRLLKTKQFFCLLVFVGWRWGCFDCRSCNKLLHNPKHSEPKLKKKQFTRRFSIHCHSSIISIQAKCCKLP